MADRIPIPMGIPWDPGLSHPMHISTLSLQRVAKNVPLAIDHGGKS